MGLGGRVAALARCPSRFAAAGIDDGSGDTGGNEANHPSALLER
jgi:hypothetical protein